MAIIETLDESLFISRFEDYKRVNTPENKNGNFTYKALRVLFEYLDDLYEENEPLELDVISLCCDFTEYDDIRDFLKNYPQDNIKYEDFPDEEEYKEALEEEINNQTTLIKLYDDLDEGFIIQNF